MARRVVLLIALIATLASWTTMAQRRVVSTPDPVAAANLALAVDRLLADLWYQGIPRAKGDVPASEDEALLASSLSSTNEHTRRLAVRSVGRFLNPLDAPFFLSQQSDSEALFWYVRVLGYTREGDKKRDAFVALLRLVRSPTPGVPVAAVFDSIARLGGLDESLAIDFERSWIEEVDKHWPYSEKDSQLPIAAAALEQLEPLLKLFPNRGIQQRTRLVLGRVAQYGLMAREIQPSLTALEALTNVKVTDRTLAHAMLAYRCPISAVGPMPPPTCGWQYRRQGVLLI